MFKKLILLLPVLAYAAAATCQVKKPAAKKPAGKDQGTNTRPLILSNKILAVARADKNEIMIRWATDDYNSWKLCSEYGVAVEKFTIVKNDKTLERFERSQPKMIIKPRPLAEWDSIANNDDNAAVIAQALYGDDFDVSMEADKGGLASVLNKTEQSQQRYNMAMYGADQSYNGAVYAGMGYTDKNVKKGEKYLYRIYPMVPASKRKMDTAFLFIGLSDYKPLPKPGEIIAEFSDKAVMLKWDFESLKEYYTSYLIERSADSGKTFTPVSDKPVTRLDDPEKKPGNGSIVYIDSLAANHQLYQYRIAGVSLFGSKGPYSDVVSGEGKFVLSLAPAITSVSLTDKGEYFVNWEIDDSAAAQIKEFRIKYAETINGEYKLFKSNIPAGDRTYKVDSLNSTNYFIVCAISKEGEEKTSLPYLLQPEDSTAPAMPAGFKASIDSNGIVTLEWEPNTEKDLAGYRVFKTNVKGHELQPLMDTLFMTNKIVDTSNLESLNSKLYYTVRAVDRRYNQSAYTPLLEVVKPDIIPPVQPVLDGYDIADDGIKITWTNSSSEDVVMHNVYRKLYGGTGDWELLVSVKDKNAPVFTDKNYAEGKKYSYTVIAVDSGKLESKPAVPFVIEAPEKRIKKAIESIEAEVDRDARTIAISWKKVKGITGIKQVEVYRGADKQPMTLYKMLDNKTDAFSDTELTVNTKYMYGVRVMFTNGRYSDFIIKNVIY